MDRIKEFALLINQANKIVCLTGAGMSTESGIPDFRSTNGLWTENRKVEALMRIGYFHAHPKKFWEAYKSIFGVKLAGQYEPNEGHRFLASLENKGKKVTIITQNIDGLHQQAGSTHVFEMHGSIHKAICPACTKRKIKNKSLQDEYPLSVIQESTIPRCPTCNTILKPDTVLFDEKIKHYKEATTALLQADLFITLGSSLLVSPVNSFPVTFKEDLYKDNSHGKSVIINRESTALDRYFDLHFHQGIGETLKEVETHLT